jgi:hypothetical protein
MMPSTIERIVNVFVSLGDRRRLENMKLERERAVLKLADGQARSRLRLEEEIEVIDAGLRKLPHN